MTLRRATLYFGGGTLLVAWFASAASISLSRSPRQIPSLPEPVASPMEDLASEIQQQSRRLRARRAAARAPQPVRNPFAFRPVVPRPQPAAQQARAFIAPPPPVQPPEPVLVMIGVAEQRRPEGLVRTAMLVTAGEELLMVSVGDTVLQRYKVTAISADGVELADATTGQTRRVVMQFMQ